MQRPIVLLLAILAASLLVGLQAAYADKRVALVVGNSAYRNVTPLDNPKNDATLMAETLRSLGFVLVGDGAQLDLDKAGIDSAVQGFGDQLQGASVGLFYYAGHGVQVRGVNYLVPVGANPTKEVDVDFQMLDANLVLRQMEAAGTKLNIVILDACRNNPFGGRGLRTTGSGLAQMLAPEGTLISFATQPGNLALDGTGGNSPYTKALAETIRRPGLDIFQTFNEVGLAVMQATGKSQQPWVSSSPIRGSFYFAGLAKSPATAVPATPPASQPAVAASPTVPPDAPVSRRAWLGARIQAVTDEIAEGLGVEPKGAIIVELNEGGPAKRAELQVGDVIVGFHGKSVRDARELARLVGDARPATDIDIVIRRRSSELRRTVSLDSPPASSPPSTKNAQPEKPMPVSPPPGTKTVKILSLDLASLTDRLREHYNVQPNRQGVVVTAYASTEQDKRLSAGDVVLEISGTAVTNVAEVQSRIEALKKSGKKVALLLVARHNSSRFVALKLP